MKTGRTLIATVGAAALAASLVACAGPDSGGEALPADAEQTLQMLNYG